MVQYQLFIDFKKSYDSIRRRVLYNILTKYYIPRKPAGLIEMRLNETYNTVHTDINLSDKFPIQNGLKQADASSSLLSMFSLEYFIRRVQGNQEGQKLNETHQLLVYADDISRGKHRYHKEKHSSSIRC
jgi:hypothetical protein